MSSGGDKDTSGNGSSGEESKEVEGDKKPPTYATRGRGANRRFRARYIRRAGGRFQNYKSEGGMGDKEVRKIVKYVLYSFDYKAFAKYVVKINCRCAVTKSTFFSYSDV